MDPITNYCEAILGNNTSAKKSIRLIPELSSCSDALLDLIFTYSKAVNIEPGEVLIQEGLYDQWVYFMVKGQLDIYINDTKLGSTPGPLVGERCIIGEPRGATLVAGDGGVMALGIEMSLMDEINREINSYRKTTEDEGLVCIYADEKNKVALELLTIVLNEVILRILELSHTSRYIMEHLTTTLKEEENGKHSIQANAEHQSIDQETVSLKLQYADFTVFSQKLHDSVIVKNPHHENLRKIEESDWYSILKLSEDGSKVQLMSAFEHIADTCRVPFADLVEVAIQMFEVASLYTANMNDSLNSTLKLFDDEKGKKGALKPQGTDPISTAMVQARVDILKRKLFDPIKKILASQKSVTVESVMKKLSQDDIDSLFD